MAYTLTTENAIEQAQELLRTILSPSVRQTEATNDLTTALDAFLAAYGVDGETEIKPTPRPLEGAELATVLAALRYWQREGLMSAGHEQDIACDGGRIEPLNDSQIEALCERLNCGEAPLQRAPLSDHEGPARSLVIRTSKGDDIEVLPEEAPGLFDEWAEWAEAQEKAVATAEDWTKVLGAADGYLSSLPLGSTGMDETAEDVRAIR